ncbi:MAG: heme exporter protein CcmB [Gammaproteobacteria bacterium]|nr:heme exporter protein CcmB [Gammaproteobacteria bacterium]
MLIANAIVTRDLTLALRRRSRVLQPLIFTLICVSLFPLALGAEVNLMKRIAPGVFWVIALLSTQLTLENLFQSDYEDGSLEQWLLAPYSLPLLIATKVLAHWLISALPLILMAPLIGVLLGMSAPIIYALMLTLLLGTPVLSLVGAIGAALTVTQRRGGVLLSLLVLPLYIPVLIFATTALEQAAAGLSYAPHLYLLGALATLALTLAPFAAAAALRIALE